MKTEDFFKLAIDQILGLDKSAIDKYFKKFRRHNKNIPSVLRSLDKKALDQEGNPLQLNDIHKDVNTLNYHLKNNSPALLNLIDNTIYTRTKLFSDEIKLHIAFLEHAFDEYEKEKQKEPINIKKVFLHIHHFSVHVANVCKLYDKLNDLIPSPFNDNSDVDIASTKELRNHLEHFEERLEAWIYLHIGKPIFDRNIIDSSTKGIKLENCLRVLEVDNDIFYILGECYSIKELIRTIKMIENNVNRIDKWANQANSADAKSRAAD